MVAAIASDQQKKQAILQMADIRSLRLFDCLFVCPVVYLFDWLCVFVLFICLLVCLFVWSSVCLCLFLSSFLCF